MSRIPLLALGAALLLVSQMQAVMAANSYEDASKQFKQGNYAEALEKIETVIAANPRDARARFLKGLILTEQNKPVDAIKVFSSLIASTGLFCSVRLRPLRNRARASRGLAAMTVSIFSSASA